MFQAGHGTDTVLDFTVDDDTIDLSAFTGITAFSDLSITAAGTTAVIDLSSHGGGTIRLENVTDTDLDAGDFTFYDTTDGQCASFKSEAAYARRRGDGVRRPRGFRGRWGSGGRCRRRAGRP